MHGQYYLNVGVVSQCLCQGTAQQLSSPNASLSLMNS